MKLEVKVATILLAKAHPPLARTEFAIQVPAGTDAEGLIEALGIPPRLVGSVTVNKKRSARDRELVDGDRVAIIPAISGG